MTIIPESLRTEMAEAQQERDSSYWADRVREAIRAVPDHAADTEWMLQVVCCLSEKARCLRPAMRERARDYFDDLYLDLKDDQS